MIFEGKMAVNIGIKTFERNESEANESADKRWYYHVLGYNRCGKFSCCGDITT